MATIINIGATLRKTRLEKEISLEEVEKETRIRKHYIEALENENWDIMPGYVYVRGFLRTYARYLGLNDEELLNAMNPLADTNTAQEIVHTNFDLPGRPTNRIVIIFAIIAILVLFIFQYTYQHFIAGKEEAARGTAVIISELEPSRYGNESDSEQQYIEKRSLISLKIKVLYNKCWMEIKSDDNLLYEGTLTAGEERIFADLSNVSFRLGNAGDTEVTINNSIVDGLGKSGEVVYREYGIINDEPTQIIP